MKSKGILLTLVTLIALIGYQCGKNTTVPDELVGVWKTSAPKYANRHVEFKKDVIAFSTGEGNVAFHPVKRVKVRKDNKILYVIYYANEEGQVYTFAFYFDPVNGGVIRFKNQEGIEWRKERH